jgi:hypothetical protein
VAVGYAAAMGVVPNKPLRGHQLMGSDRVPDEMTSPGERARDAVDTAALVPDFSATDGSADGAENP